MEVPKSPDMVQKTDRMGILRHGYLSMFCQRDRFPLKKITYPHQRI